MDITEFSLVRGNYPLKEGNSSRKKIFDIAILENNKPSGKFYANGNPLFQLNVDTAIEIKFAMFDNDKSKDFKEDARRLKNLIDSGDIKTGIALCFSHKDMKWSDTKPDSKFKGSAPENVINIMENKLNIVIIDTFKIESTIIE